MATEFPRDDVILIAKAILAQQFTPDLVKPILRVLAYAAGMIGDATRPLVGAAVELPDDALASMLLDAADAEPGVVRGDGDAPNVKALPWLSIVKLLGKILIGLL